MTNKGNEQEQENEEQVGQNNPREEMRKHIYAQADERRAADPDFSDVADGDHEKLSEVEGEQEQEQKAEEQQAPAKRKFKVNGKELELTEDEINEYVQKAASAEEKFQEAARLRKEAEELAARAPVKPAPEQNVVEDDVALARALQMGSEEEVVAAIRKIRASAAPSVKPAELMAMVDQKLSFQAQTQKFLGEYKDVMEDPAWRDLVLDREEQLAIRGEKPGYDRMKKAGDWARDLKAKAKPPESREQKLERKGVHSSQRVQAANVRQAAPEEEDKDESPSETIANMAKARGQSVVRGNV